jgi:membrane fusion protein, multidrug efflux system
MTLQTFGSRRQGVLALSFTTALAILLSACDRAPATTDNSGGGAPLLIAAEDTITLHPSALTAGPLITGSVQPERRADLRAEVSAMVLKVMRENGDVVHRGDVLVQLDDTSIRDALTSAEAAGRTAGMTLEQATRQLERQQTLRRSGMTTAQSLEDAEARRNNALSDFEAAKARIVSARQQLTRTLVRAPFDGIVSDRKVSAGDTAQQGKELIKVIDPASLRFEGVVSADQIGVVRAGQPVSFRVNGYGDQDFAGRVRRVNPAANTATRQVEVLVDFAGPAQPRLAGLYAEGRVDAETRMELTLPASAVVRESDKTFAWLIKEGKVRKSPITLGARNPRTGDYALANGAAEGDQVLRQPSALIKDGQAVQADPAAHGATSNDAAAKS